MRLPKTVYTLRATSIWKMEYAFHWCVNFLARQFFDNISIVTFKVAKHFFVGLANETTTLDRLMCLGVFAGFNLLQSVV